MPLRLPALKTVALAVTALVVVWLVFAWLALPRIVQAQAEKFVAEKTGHRLHLDRPEFNPFELSLRLANLHLDEPQGKPLLAFRALTIDLSAASIARRAVVFDSIRLEAPVATLELQTDGRLNWSPFLDALKSKEDKPDAPLPRLDIEQFVLAGGVLDFADRKSSFATRIEPLDLELSDISTLPSEREQGRYQVAARTAIGARVLWHGTLALNPVVATGKLGVEELDLAKLAPYLKKVLPAGPPAGVAALSTEYRAAYGGGRFDLSLDNIAARMDGLRVKIAAAGPEVAIEAIEAKNGRFDLARRSASLAALTLTNSQVRLAVGAPLRFGTLALEEVQVDLAGRQAGLGRIALQGGQLKAVRNAQGRIDLLDAVEALKAPGKAAPQLDGPAEAAAPWRFLVNKVELAGLEAVFQDQSVKPAADLALQDIAVSVDNLGSDLSRPLPIRAALQVREGGRLEASGQVVPAAPSADVKFKLADLALKPAQPYLNSFIKLKLASGKLDIDGNAGYDKRGAAFKGGFALRALRLTESETGALFLAWKQLGSRDLKLTPAGLDIGTLALDGLDTKLLIGEDKSINVSHLLRKPEAAAAKSGQPPAAQAEVGGKTAAAPFQVNLDRLRIRNGELDFADHSLALPFGTRIHHLRGAVTGLSTRRGGPGQIELDGQVDEYGLARAVGQIDLFRPTEFTDIKVVFRNVEMNRLTPYSATFAGRKIESGKLSLDLEYRIKQRQLTGDNKVVMDRLTLGERVESPTAKSLPLDLAIAILQDTEGRIDLGLPVSGSLDDPQFSYGAIIWKAILNVFTKIATAPFRMLGSLFGAGEKFESIAFEAGAARLTPPEREKLVRLAEALAKRPALTLTLHGVHADVDRAALQDRQLRQVVARIAGQQDVKEEGDPGPLSTRAPKVQAAIEQLYGERVGSGELAALKAGFRQANPGQMEEGMGGRMLSRVTRLVREQRTLGAEEVAQLKGADFHAVLFEQLRARETVTDERLLALARARGESTLAALTAAGAPAERLTLGAPERVAASGREIPLKLVLGAAAKNVFAAPAPAAQ